jgi:NAD-dependent SIR2 family protein deacetylase
MECHGTAWRVQCCGPCGEETWAADPAAVALDAAGVLAVEPLPRCARCGLIARPNIRFFDDAQWVGRVTAGQSGRFEAWKGSVAGRRVAVVVVGAGDVVPAARLAGDWAVAQLGATLIRINPEDAEVSGPGQVPIPMTAGAGLAAIDRAMGRGECAAEGWPCG